MGTLAERLDRMREGSKEQIPAAAQAVMTSAKEALAASGILDRLPDVGSELPAFELKDGRGELVRSADLLAHGPLVATVYRGFW